MLLSVQGNEVLSKMWDQFLSAYAHQNPDSNPNDAERAFLFHTLRALANSDCMELGAHDSFEIETLINRIR